MNKNEESISVIIPVYGCASSLKELSTRLFANLDQLTTNTEILFINDASPDDAWDTIQTLAQTDKRIKGINLSRNFGQHYAITAGLDFAQGDWVVVMDCDLQDRPEEIPKLYNKAKEGFDLVIGKRIDRKDSLLRKLGSRLFYKIFNYFAEQNVDSSISSFGIYSRKVIRSISALREQSRSFGLFALWVGFKRIEIDIEHAPRSQGQSSYNLRRMVLLALDSVTAHSNRLLRIFIKIGFTFSFLALFYALWLTIKYFVWQTPVVGWTSMMVSIYFLAGMVISSIGMVGIYIGKIFDEVKGRPLYIVESTTFELKEKDV